MYDVYIYKRYHGRISSYLNADCFLINFLITVMVYSRFRKE